MNNKEKTIRILLVDDDPEICRLLQRILERQGRKFVTAGSVQRATEILRTTHVDLVFVDLYLPDGKGVQLLMESKSPASEHPPIIVMTAFGDWESHIDSYNQGAYYFLDKPFSTWHVRTLVDEALAQVQ